MAEFEVAEFMNRSMQIELRFREIEIDIDARYADVYRAMSAAVSQHWPSLPSVSETQQGIAKEKAVVEATNALMQQLDGNRRSQSQTHAQSERKR